MKGTRQSLRVGVVATVFASVAPIAARAADDAAAVLTVRCAGDSTSNAAGLTLRQALDAATRDPRPNVIRFDAALAKGGSIAIELRTPLTVESSSGAAADTIDGTNTPVTLRVGELFPGVIVARGASLTVRGSTLVGGANGIKLTDCPRVTLERCTIRNSAGAGVAAFGQGRVDLIRCTIVENRTHGVELHDAFAMTAVDTGLRRNGQSGVVAFDRSATAVEHCEIEANGHWGVVATDEGRVRVAATILSDAGFADVDAGEASRFEITDSLLQGRSRFGVIAAGQARVSLDRCAITDHASRGIELQDEARAALTRTAVDRNADFGIVAFGRSMIGIEGGTVRRNGGHGLAVRDRAAADVLDCAFEGNQFSGVGAPDAGAGVRVAVRRCTFRDNGMRPIFRGPLHLDPPVPTVVQIAGDVVTVRASPNAEVDLFADRAGEAARYLRTVRADAQGRFEVRRSAVGRGEVITAAATTGDGHTSEFNVIAGPIDRAVLAALVARTGPLSDGEGAIDSTAAIHRWRPGTTVIFHLIEPPAPHVEAYVLEFVKRANEWVGGTIRVAVRTGGGDEPLSDGRGTDHPTHSGATVVIPVRFAAEEDECLKGTGGTTFTRWDATGYFTGPVRIFLARPEPGQVACPRVLVHEMCHALGLYHARVGLLSRMQGIPLPPKGYLNDFSPFPTFYDVAALRILYDDRLMSPTSVAQLTKLGLLPGEPVPSREAVTARRDVDSGETRTAAPSASEGTFSPSSNHR